MLTPSAQARRRRCPPPATAAVCEQTVLPDTVMNFTLTIFTLLLDSHNVSSPMMVAAVLPCAREGRLIRDPQCWCAEAVTQVRTVRIGEVTPV